MSTLIAVSVIQLQDILQSFLHYVCSVQMCHITPVSELGFHLRLHLKLHNNVMTTFVESRSDETVSVIVLATGVHVHILQWRHTQGPTRLNSTNPAVPNGNCGQTQP